jgi:hypothetical protein
MFQLSVGMISSLRQRFPSSHLFLKYSAARRHLRQIRLRASCSIEIQD